MIILVNISRIRVIHGKGVARLTKYGEAAQWRYGHRTSGTPPRVGTLCQHP